MQTQFLTNIMYRRRYNKHMLGTFGLRSAQAETGLARTLCERSDTGAGRGSLTSRVAERMRNPRPGRHKPFTFKDFRSCVRPRDRLAGRHPSVAVPTHYVRKPNFRIGETARCRLETLHSPKAANRRRRPYASAFSGLSASLVDFSATPSTCRYSIHGPPGTGPDAGFLAHFHLQARKKRISP